MPLSIFVIAVVSLLGTGALTVSSSALRYLRKYHSKDQLNVSARLFFYRRLHQLFFKKKDFNTLYFATLCARHIFLFCYAISAIFFLIAIGDLTAYLPPTLRVTLPHLSLLFNLAVILVALALSLLIGDLLPRTWASRQPESAFRKMAPLASLFLILCFPISFVFIKLFYLFTKGVSEDTLRGVSPQYSDKLIEILHEAQEAGQITHADQILISSVIHFKDRIVREIMVPRIEVFALPYATKVSDAAKLLIQEGYSRVPIYKENIDHILGILMYKDVLRVYMDPDRQIDQTIENLVKPVLYTPETKKVSYLLQEFRNKQNHMAIVVDEYGGTEGLVTIEDILEEIVGEIEDEYDVQEELLFLAQPSGGWIVDARMSILDAEETFHIKIPQDGEYDTIAGYIFHRAGTIPAKGFRIHHDEFDMEVLSSNDRTVRKVRIIPRPPSTDVEESVVD